MSREHKGLTEVQTLGLEVNTQDNYYPEWRGSHVLCSLDRSLTKGLTLLGSLSRSDVGPGWLGTSYDEWVDVRDGTRRTVGVPRGRVGGYMVGSLCTLGCFRVSVTTTLGRRTPLLCLGEEFPFQIFTYRF